MCGVGICGIGEWDLFFVVLCWKRVVLVGFVFVMGGWDLGSELGVWVRMRGLKDVGVVLLIECLWWLSVDFFFF